MKQILSRIITLILVFATTGLLAEDNQRINEIAEQYVKLVLALGQHDPNYVDAYYGPAEWKTLAEAKKIEPKKIIIAAKSLQDLLALEKFEEPQLVLRAEYLSTQLSSLSARALMLANSNRFSFEEQAKMLFDTVPPRHNLADFDLVLEQLKQMLPGEGDLSTKLEEFRKQFYIPREKLRTVFDAAIEECRKRTKQHIQLLEKENFQLEFVTEKSWSGYNWYQGNGFSLIQVNVDLPIEISRAVDLGCHEGYPGHHTYNGLLESHLAQKNGWVEFSVYPLFSPQSLIAEGSANYGIELAFPNQEKLIFEQQVLFPLAGMNPKLANQYESVQSLVAKLDYAGNEIARQLLNQEIDDNIALSLLQKYSLMSEKKAEKRIAFIKTYGAYVINYNWGKDLVKEWVEASQSNDVKARWQRFSLLLSTPRLPSTLQKEMK